MKSIFSRIASSGVVLAVVTMSLIAFAFLSTHAHAQEAPQTPQIDVSSSGSIQLDRTQISPLYLEFTGSHVGTCQ